MKMNSGFLQQKTGSIRDPISNAQKVGPTFRTPRFAELGGFTSAGKGFKKNRFTITKPGNTNG